MTQHVQPPLRSRIGRALAILTLILIGSIAIGLTVGSQHIDLARIFSDPLSRTLFFRLRLPRVLLGLIVGASLALTGGALQALFRNPLADPYTLGVSGGGALGATIALALGWSARLAGVPLVFIASFVGAMIAVSIVRAIARTGVVLLPGALLLSGVAVNLIAAAAVLTIEYLAAPSSALQILRWLIGSLDVVGLAPLARMMFVLAPAWVVLLFFSRQLNLIAIDEDTATTLGVNVGRCEEIVHAVCALVVGVTVSVGGAIGFVGLIVPHAVRMMFGEDLRIVLPGSLLLGASFLILADALARSVLPAGELPVGAITGLLGGLSSFGYSVAVSSIQLSNMSLLIRTLAEIRPVDPRWIQSARERQLQLTKPPGSLGRLEDIANRCAAIHESFAFTVRRPLIALFAADHGVCAEGVSAYPQEVTAQMVLNFLSGGAAINAFARSCQIDLKVVDVGVAAPLPASDRLISCRMRNGTRNFCVEPAMTDDEMHAALAVGSELAHASVSAGCDLLGFGEMGIGNTTSASAIAAALSGRPVETLIGPGAGADDAVLKRKTAAIGRALALHSAHLHDPLGILRCLGGFEIAAMCGFVLGAASRRVPVVTDGFIATAAATLAVRLSPAASGFLFTSHRSAEPGHDYFLENLGQQPLLDLGMRLGEGTGAVLAMKLIEASIAAFTQMATFSSAGVSNK